MLSDFRSDDPWVYDLIIIVLHDEENRQGNKKPGCTWDHPMGWWQSVIPLVPGCFRGLVLVGVKAWDKPLLSPLKSVAGLGDRLEL